MTYLCIGYLCRREWGEEEGVEGGEGWERDKRDKKNINLSIEKNPVTESVEIIIDNNVIGFVLNSTIYDLDMLEIGKLFGGRYSQENINDFWEGVDYSKGNISIYDYTGIYKIGSLYHRPFVDHYAILGMDRVENPDSSDSRALRKTIRNTQKTYYW